MKKFILFSVLIPFLFHVSGCGKKTEAQPEVSTSQQINTNSQKTNKLATFVQPKPRTNFNINITPAKKTENQDKTSSQPSTTNITLKLTPQQPPQTIAQPQIDYGSEQVETLKIKASNGDTSAQLELASRLLYGRGVNKDENEAIQWLTAAAQAGNPTAQNRLGLLYSSGQAVQKDPTQAVYWYKLAAEQNHPTAQNNLGIMYATGNGVEKDDIEAYKWLTLAGQRITNALIYRDTIARRMTSEQIEAANQKALELSSQFNATLPNSK